MQNYTLIRVARGQDRFWKRRDTCWKKFVFVVDWCIQGQHCLAKNESAQGRKQKDMLVRELRIMGNNNNKIEKHQIKNEDKLYLKRSLLMKGSPKTCPQTGSSVSDDANANPQLFNDDESSISALLYKS